VPEKMVVIADQVISNRGGQRLCQPWPYRRIRRSLTRQIRTVYAKFFTTAAVTLRGCEVDGGPQPVGAGLRLHKAQWVLFEMEFTSEHSTLARFTVLLGVTTVQAAREFLYIGNTFSIVSTRAVSGIKKMFLAGLLAKPYPPLPVCDAKR
jgi:hypothetical protein